MGNIKKQIDKEMAHTCFDTEAFMAHWNQRKTAWDRRRRIRRGRVVAAILAASVCCGGVGTYAAVNYFGQRGAQLTQEEIDTYVEDISNAPVNADTYSRELTPEERARKEELMDKYLQEGLYPKEKLLKIASEEEIVEDRVCFLPETSTFYLPERELNDEDLLEIIDHDLMIDYSLAQREDLEEQRQKETKDAEQSLAKSGTEEISMDEAIALAKEVVHRMYEEDVDHMEVTTGKNTYCVKGEKEPCSDGEIYFTSENGEAQYYVLVDLITKEIKILDSYAENQNDYAENIKPGDILDKNLVQGIKEKACLFMGEQSSIQNGYVQVITDQDGNLGHGIVCYFFEMDDNSILEADYSYVSNRIFSFAIMSKESFFSKKEKLTEQSLRENTLYQCINID